MEPECVESDILKQAMRMEDESRQFYLDAAEKVENRLGRKMLESLAEDEAGHRERLAQLQRGETREALAQCKPEFEYAAMRVRVMFGEFGSLAAEEVAADTDDLEALDIAMEMERKGFDLYKQASKKSKDRHASEVLLFLAHEEEKHFEVLQNMHRYLADPRAWFLEEEQGLLDGG
jgi:rubrerythrin